MDHLVLADMKEGVEVMILFGKNLKSIIMQKNEFECKPQSRY